MYGFKSVSKSASPKTKALGVFESFCDYHNKLIRWEQDIQLNQTVGSEAIQFLWGSLQGTDNVGCILTLLNIKQSVNERV